MDDLLKISGKGDSDTIQRLIDSLPFYVLLVDENHNIFKANRAVMNQLGLDPEDIVGQFCPRVVHGIDGPFHGCPLEESVETGNALEREVFDEHSGRWLSSAIYPTDLSTDEGYRVYFHMVLDITERKSIEDAQTISSERLRILSAYLEKAIEEERQKIARDLHDDVSQVIASINAHLASAINKLPEGSDDSRNILKKAEGFSVQLLERIHRLIYQLRPSILDDFGLIAAIQWLSQNTLEISGITVDIKSRNEEPELTSELKTIIFRLFQEVFSNIVKHSKATQVTIRLSFNKNNIRINIKDNGVGFKVNEAFNTSDRPRGLGLVGMEERIDYLGGEFDIKSEPGKGTSKVINIPLPGKKQQQIRTRQYLWSKYPKTTSS